MRIVHDSGAAEEREWHEPPAPQAPPAQTQGDRGWFWLRLFTPAERSRWNAIRDHAASVAVADRLADPFLDAVYNAHQDLAQARLISLDEPAVIAGVTTLCRHAFSIAEGVTLTVLASDTRRDQVLAGVIVA